MALDLKERDRRYGLLRERMAEQGLDALVVIGNAQINQKGYVKYLTNYRSILYNLVVLFPLKGEPRLLVPSPVQKYWAGLLSWIGQIGGGDTWAERSSRKGAAKHAVVKGKLGLISDTVMPAHVYRSLVSALPDASIVDATSIIEDARMIKTPGEQALVRDSAALADLSFTVMADVLKPGMTERVLIAEIYRALIAAVPRISFISFPRSRGPLPLCSLRPRHRAGRCSHSEHRAFRPGGYWVQMVRTSFVRAPRADVQRMYEVLMRICAEVPGQLRPGRRLSDVAAWVRDEILTAGYGIGVHFGHCLGLDVVERPLVHIKDETHCSGHCPHGSSPDGLR